MTTLKGILSYQNAVSFLAILTLVVVAGSRLTAADPEQPPEKAAKLETLLKERLATALEIEKVVTEAHKSGISTFEEVHEARRLVLDAELALCTSDKERVVVLEKTLAAAKELEETAASLYKAGSAPARTALKAKAGRLQAEIALERIKANLAASSKSEKPPQGIQDQVARAEVEVAIKQAAVKVIEAQREIALAKLRAAKAAVEEVQVAVLLAEKQVKRLEELEKDKAVASEVVDERRAHWENAKARRTGATAKLSECESNVKLEEARIEVAKLEVAQAVLFLKQAKVGSEK